MNPGTSNRETSRKTSKADATVISRMVIVFAFLSLSLLMVISPATINTRFYNKVVQSPPANAAFDHIVTVLMENQGLCDIYTGCGGSATYQSHLADQNTLVMTWGTINHNSEPNYIALLGAINDGSTSRDGVCCFFETTPNLIDRIESAGLTWQAFAEDASNSGTCSFSPPRSGDHFPFIDFSDMNTAARCSHFQTTASSTDNAFIASLTPSAPNFVWLTPNDCDNGHDTCSSSSGIAGGDAYLSQLVPRVLSSPLFTATGSKATLLVLYDEGYTQCNNTGGTGECVFASFSGPAAKKGSQISPSGASHYSYAAMIETAWGLSSINSNDASAPNILDAFGVCTSNCALVTSFTISPTQPHATSTVTFTATTTGGTAPYTVTWSFGDGTSATGASVTHTYSRVQSFNVTETVTDSSSPSRTTSSSQTIQVANPGSGGLLFPLSNTLLVMILGSLIGLATTLTLLAFRYRAKRERMTRQNTQFSHLSLS